MKEYASKLSLGQRESLREIRKYFELNKKIYIYIKICGMQLKAYSQANLLHYRPTLEKKKDFESII